jgi:hypothetical protein
LVAVLIRGLHRAGGPIPVLIKRVHLPQSYPGLLIRVVQMRGKCWTYSSMPFEIEEMSPRPLPEARMIAAKMGS